MGIYLHLTVSLAFTYVIFSIDEYFVHRTLMHKMRVAKFFKSKWLGSLCYNHMSLHHKRGYRHDTHEEDDNIFHVTLAAAIPVVFIGIPMCFVDPLTAYVIFAFGCVYAATWWVIHHEMHRDQGRFFTTTFLFRHLERKHQLHHIYPGTNFSLILPLSDWLFGTLASKEQIKKAGLN